MCSNVFKRVKHLSCLQISLSFSCFLYQIGSLALRLGNSTRTQTFRRQRREPQTLQTIGQSTQQGHAVCPISSPSSLLLLSWWIFNCSSKHLGQDMCVRTDKAQRPPVAAACFWPGGGKSNGRNGCELWVREQRGPARPQRIRPTSTIICRYSSQCADTETHVMRGKRGISLLHSFH